MSDANNQDMMPFDLPKNKSSVIKVLGVGGGGSNAVNHMYAAGINGVDFVVCNTDAQALENSPVPNKFQLGVSLTEGLGAGANPEVGQKAAQESLDEISKLLETNTKMLFITAGMGGGTGTGAAPVIAKAAKDLGILTVGIVTSPFLFEGRMRQEQAEKGIESLRSNVDSLVVINNNKLREVYGNLGFKAGFAKADEVLSTAARGIAEVITHHYTTNIDLRDARTVLANSGTAIMGAATARGDNRAKEAITAALDSPLLNDNHIRGAKNVLLLIVSGHDEITIDEIGEVNDYIQNEAGGAANIIMGIGEDESLGDDVAITIIATGFNPDQQKQVIGKAPEKIVHPLEDDQAISTSLYDKPIQMDEEDSDSLLDAELDRALTREQEKQQEVQASLFGEQEESYPTSQPLPELHQEEEQKEVYKLEEESPEFKGGEELEEEVPFNFEVQAETIEEASFDLEEATELEQEPQIENEIPSKEEIEEDTIRFDLGEEMEEETESIFEGFPLSDQINAQKEEEKVEEPLNHQDPELEDDAMNFDFFTIDQKEEDLSTPAEMESSEEGEEEAMQTNYEAPQRKVYSLSDYEALEAQLNAEPEASKATAELNTEVEIEAEKEDDALRFEVKTKVDKPASKESSRVADPMNSSIEESMRLRAEERRAKLKAFNYRFKNNPHSLDETDKEPAYKRHGIDIEQGSISRKETQSRMTLNNSEGGNDLKSNNSFLHDNVD